MCGIAGVLLRPGKRVDPDRVAQMGEAIHHRGPDNFGTHVHENYGVAHTRLSILDLSAHGNQPFVRDGFSLAYNGEIYNYLDLRRELVDEGVEFQGTSDTEVLFNLLILDGVEKTLRRIRGMYAFSFYDSRDKTLYLCRDRLGIKPLLYRFEDGELVWGSEVKAIAGHTPVEIDPTRLLHSAGLLFDGRGEHTVFRNVMNVPAGMYLKARPGELPALHRHHDWADEIDEQEYRSLESSPLADVVQRFDQLMQSSLAGMMLSDAPMGVFASGGIDSSLVAAMAFGQDPGLALFTADVVGKYSELEDARLLSRSLGAQLHEAPYAAGDVLREWPRGTWHYEAPLIAHMNALPLGVIAELTQATGVKAVLTGEGSDELFLGYAPYVARRYRKLTAPVDLMIKVYGVIPSVRHYLFPREGSNVESFFPKLLSDFDAETSRERFDEAYSFLPESKRQDHLATTQLLNSHLASLLHRNDRMGMMAGIESRFPFLDEGLVRFALNLPVKFKIRPVARFHNRRHPFLMDKAVVRLLAAKRLPNRLAGKIKFGFPTYAHQSIVIDQGLFADGYVQHAFQLSSAATERLVSDRWRYFGALMASVEVFGRLFQLGDQPDEITAHLQRFVTVDERQNSKTAIQ